MLQMYNVILTGQIRIQLADIKVTALNEERYLK
jgi:hypothetical protein